jgi:hypothetical protein
MNNLKIPAALLLAVAIIYGAAKGYVYYQTSSSMDRAVQQASLFANISYGGISSDLLKGRVSVENITISPVTLSDTVRIREASLQGDGPLFLFTEAGKLGNNTPDLVNLAIRGIELDLNGELFSSYNSMAGQAQNVSGPVPACDFGGSLAASDMQELGYDQVVADLGLQLVNQKLSGKTRMTADIDVEGIGSFEFDASFKGTPSASTMMVSPGADQVSLSWSVNPEYMKSVIAYCAKKTNQDQAAYMDYIASASDKDYLKVYGIVPGPAIRDAIRSFMVKPGKVEIRMLPIPDMNPMLLQQYRPEDIIEMLGMHLYINEEEIKPLEFTFGDEISSLFGDKTTAKADAQAKAKEVEQAKSSYVFQDTPLERLPQYVGAQVRVSQTDGLEREGTLVALTKDEAQIEQRLHGGKFSVFVPMNKIRKVQVLRLKKE